MTFYILQLNLWQIWLLALHFPNGVPSFITEQEYTLLQVSMSSDGSRRRVLPVNSLATQSCTDFKNNISIAVIPSSDLKVMFLKNPVGGKL